MRLRRTTGSQPALCGGWYGWNDWWFRVLGRGLSFEDHRVRPPLFSERMGYAVFWHLGPFCLRVLPRWEL